MRSTEECKAMNEVYSGLKGLSLEQLYKFRDKVLVNFGGNIPVHELLLYQVDYAISKRKESNESKIDKQDKKESRRW
jgi:hypothetical protein